MDHVLISGFGDGVTPKSWTKNHRGNHYVPQAQF